MDDRTPSETPAGIPRPAEHERGDFESDQAIRWCPGCGDYAILAQMQRVMPRICRESGLSRADIVFISGIGCSGRFPYYMNTYGFHTIHGRAPTVATGLKVTRPDLQVWVITGDGDGLSIGGNHLIHCLRRNIDVKILLFNNRIYGLTKGQYSPTSELGKRTQSSPFGTLEAPINPVSIALAAEGTFVARAVATDTEHLQEILLRTARHRGSAFVEIYQNCNVFNDRAFDDFAARPVRDERTVLLRHGAPLVFGKHKDQGIALCRGADGRWLPQVVNIAEQGTDDLVVHDEHSPDSASAFMLSRFAPPEFPVPLGVFRDIRRPVYGDRPAGEAPDVSGKGGKMEFERHLRTGEIWTVK